MKIKITCPKCGSTNVRITSDSEKPVPMYKCNSCGYEHNLFPEFGGNENEE